MSFRILLIVFIVWGNQVLSQNTVLNSPFKNKVNFGQSLSIGDFNGDKKIDLVALAPRVKDKKNQFVGAFSVFYGSQFKANPDFICYPKLQGVISGISKSAAGDLNNDGFDELVVSNQFYGEPQPDRGFVQIFWGNSSGITQEQTSTKIGETAYGSFGSNVACFDFNGDGINDLLVESRFAEILEGRIYIFFGGKNFSLEKPDMSLQVEKSQSLYFAFSDDLNSDGNVDIVCRSNSNWNANKTKVIIFYGGKNCDSKPDSFFEVENFSPYAFIPENNWMLGWMADKNGQVFTKGIKLNDSGIELLDLKLEGRLLNINNQQWILYSDSNSIRISEFLLSGKEFKKIRDLDFLPENATTSSPFIYYDKTKNTEYFIFGCQTPDKEYVLVKKLNSL